MSKRKPTLNDLWHEYINQPTPPSDPTMKYVAALKARIDVLELDMAFQIHENKQLKKSNSTFAADAIKKD